MVSFDVGSVITGDGSYSFALSSASTKAWASFRSSEYGKQAPTLVLDFKKGGGHAAAHRDGEPDGEADRLPEADGEPDRHAHQAGPAGAEPDPGGQHDVRRLVPGREGGREQGGVAGPDGRPVQRAGDGAGVLHPAAGMVERAEREQAADLDLVQVRAEGVAAGKHDAYLKNWFQTAPRDQDVYWTFYHEPEDNVAGGEFVAADYRAAWTRLRQLANAANNPRLHATLILMDWTLNPLSGRKWKDFYAGKNVIQVLGWDAYNTKAKKGEYQPVEEIFGPVVAASKAEGLPFAIAETGSHLVAGDKGAGRAAWATVHGEVPGREQGPVRLVLRHRLVEVERRGLGRGRLPAPGLQRHGGLAGVLLLTAQHR